ncbi:hypothetical protein IAU60_005305 [Kwoniella sp. DSM 27419]
MSDQSPTPTPRKTRRPRRGVRPSQRRLGGASDTALDGQAEMDNGFDPSTDDEDTLFDILGVASPMKEPSPRRGLLTLSKDDMEVARGSEPDKRRQRQPRRKPDKSNANTDSEAERKPARRHDGSPAPERVRGQVEQSQGDEVERGVGSEGDVSRKDQGKQRNRRGKKSAPPLGGNDDAQIQSGEGGTPRPAKVKQSGISASRPKQTGRDRSQMQITQSNGDFAENVGQGSTYDLASLSKSLPTLGFVQPGYAAPDLGGRSRNGKKGNGNGTANGDESAVWEMPEVAGGQELTWQQKLQGGAGNQPSDSPRRNKSNTTDRKAKPGKSTLNQQASASPAVSSPLHSRPVHQRRASLDNVPNASANVSTAPSRTISAFDSHIPFHTGFNVHRAPQTPAKAIAAAHGNTPNGILPIVGSGEFPRLPGGPGSTTTAARGQGERRGSGAVGSGAGLPGAVFGVGPKYAGPTFHNSPAAASLSKPDLEDF